VTARTLQVRLRLLEEVGDLDQLDELNIDPTRITDPILEFLRSAVDRINADPDMAVSAVAPDLIPPGGLAEIELVLCSPEAFKDVLEQPDNVLGVHLVSTPALDPFGEEAPHARAYRIAIPFDAEVVMGRIRDAVTDFDGTLDEADLAHGAMGWLVTLPHEVQHVLWFAGNGSFNSPADLDVMEGEIGHDLFDMNTGYGLRALLLDGEEVEPENAEDATKLLEMMVEERGRLMAERVFRNDLGPGRFLAPLSELICEKEESNENSLEMTP
jgi:hypothetical protein